MVYVKLKKPQIFGLCGPKGVGKDHFANLVLGFNPNFKILKFATPLKRMVHEIWGFSLQSMEKFDSKELAFQEPIEMDKFLPAMIQKTGLALEKKGKFAKNIREILQFFGSEYVRASQQNYWIELMRYEIQRAKTKVLITDCRFKNEIELVKDLGGSTIFISRVGAQQSNDPHISENSIREIDCDVSLKTVFDKFDIQKRVAFLIALNKADGIKRFHFPTIQNALSEYSLGRSISDCAQMIGFQRKESKAFDIFLEYYGLHKRKSAVRVQPQQLSGHKTCSTCKLSLPFSNFGRSSRSYDSLFCICKTCRTRTYKKSGQINTIERLFRNVQKTARMRQISFDLTLVDLEQKIASQGGRCFYSGLPMEWVIASKQKFSIDRIDSKIGYTKENTVFCCYAVNIMKNKFSLEDFNFFIDAIYKNRANFPTNN
jgi:hypothetical protein